MDIFRKIANSKGLVSDADGVSYPTVLRLKLPDNFIRFTSDSLKKGKPYSPAAYLSFWFSKNASRGKIHKIESSLYNALYHSFAKGMSEEDIDTAGKRFLERRIDSGYLELLNTFKKAGKPVIVCSRNPAAKYILRPPHITDVVSNEMLFKENKFDKVVIDMLDGKDKKKKVDNFLKKKYGSGLEDFTYIGDSDQDIIPGKTAKVFLASCYSRGKCRSEGHLVEDYRSFARRLREEMPSVL
ncbi:MAG: haloacid dehalogenase-like hydrolase [Candidatus Aenigmarchaeota archaeon]|nr:haloacid dehalogenase-like hydrolase [Candidatus Aenigmarchaeota archaeon]